MARQLAKWNMHAGIFLQQWLRRKLALDYRKMEVGPDAHIR